MSARTGSAKAGKKPRHRRADSRQENIDPTDRTPGNTMHSLPRFSGAPDRVRNRFSGVEMGPTAHHTRKASLKKLGAVSRGRPTQNRTLSGDLYNSNHIKG